MPYLGIARSSTAQDRKQGQLRCGSMGPSNSRDGSPRMAATEVANQGLPMASTLAAVEVVLRFPGPPGSALPGVATRVPPVPAADLGPGAPGLLRAGRIPLRAPPI